MKNLALLFLVFFTLSSCTNHQPLEFSNEKLEFKLPSGWHVKKFEKLENSSQFITLQNGKILPDGLISIKILSGQQDLNSLVQFHKDISANIEIGAIDVESIFENTESTQFGIYETLSSNFKTEILMTKANGRIYVFHHGDTTVVLLFRELRMKKEIYETAIAEMEKSLKMKSE